MNLLLDTNVLIDYLGGKEPFFQDAQRIVAAGYFGDATLWASAQSFKDAFYVLSHFVDALKVQAALLRLTDVVHLVDLTAVDVNTALRLGWKDFEDCLVAVSAGKLAADYLVTRDAKGFSRSLVPAVPPGEWLAIMREQKHLEYDAVCI